MKPPKNRQRKKRVQAKPANSAPPNRARKNPCRHRQTNRLPPMLQHQSPIRAAAAVKKTNAAIITMMKDKDKAAMPKAKAAKADATAMPVTATTSAYAVVKKARNSNLSRINTPSKHPPNPSCTKFWYRKPSLSPIWHTKWPSKAWKWSKP